MLIVGRREKFGPAPNLPIRGHEPSQEIFEHSTGVAILQRYPDHLVARAIFSVPGSMPCTRSGLPARGPAEWKKPRPNSSHKSLIHGLHTVEAFSYSSYY